MGPGHISYQNVGAPQEPLGENPWRLAGAAQQAEISANAGWVSQYYYRGLLQKNSSASAGLDVAVSDFSAGTWAADVGDGAEVDLYASYGIAINDLPTTMLDIGRSLSVNAIACVGLRFVICGTRLACMGSNSSGVARMVDVTTRVCSIMFSRSSSLIS